MTRRPDRPGTSTDHRTDRLLTQVEGRQPVLAALEAGRRRIHTVFVQEGLRLDDIVAAAKRAHARIETASAERVLALAHTDAPQGVVARGDPLPLADIDDLVAPPPALLLALDGVVDPRNLGACARAAESAGATGLVSSRHRASPLTAAAAKAAAGALEYLPVALVGGIPAALRRLREQGLWIVVLDGEGSDSIWGHHLLVEPLVLVVGSEGKGASRLAKDLADSVAKIPLTGRTGSLNAATAAAVALFEVRRVRVERLVAE